jgi:hypothetical protein
MASVADASVADASVADASVAEASVADASVADKDEDIESLDYWINYYALSADIDYKEKPEYILAQEFWLPIKAELLKQYNNILPHRLQAELLVKNITINGFYERDGCFTVSAFIKMNYDKPLPEHRYCLQNYHSYLTLIYDPNMILRKQICLTDYDGFTYDMGMFLKYDYMLDTQDQEAIDKELYGDFIKMTGYNDVSLEDLSAVFTAMFQPFQKGSSTKIYF